MECTSASRLPDGWLLALLVPEEPDRTCSLIGIRDSAVGLSEALGGVLLDECAVDGLPTHRCWLYLDAARHEHRLPRNENLDRLAATLGWPPDRLDDWRGPALVTGRDLAWADRDIPAAVLAAALPTDADTAASATSVAPATSVASTASIASAASSASTA
jgi:hypothetical protein